MSKRKRRYFSAADKVKAVKQHLVNMVPVSDICDELDISTRLYYKWQDEFFSNGEQVFERTERKKKKSEDVKLRKLEEDLKNRNEAIAFLLEDNIKLKKHHGLI